MATEQPVPPEPCPNAAHMGEHACANRHQCWEPCGELGHSAEHARVASARTELPQPIAGKWVPLEPTDAMVAAMALSEASGQCNGVPTLGMAGAEEAYAAMLAAAPAGEVPPTSERFELTRSVIYNCPALRLPQSFVEKLGGVAQVVALKGASPEFADHVLRCLNRVPAGEVPEPTDEAKDKLHG